MKKSQSIIPLKLRAEMAKDPFYSSCALYGQVIGGMKHDCRGAVTWEHTLIYAGSKIQEKWAIIPLCEKYHGVNWYQDSGFLVKEINVWVALNRATDDELRAKSKAINYIRERKRLNVLYGPYVHIAPKDPSITHQQLSFVSLSNERLLEVFAVRNGQYGIIVLHPHDDEARIKLAGEIKEIEQEILSRMHEPENIKIKSI